MSLFAELFSCGRARKPRETPTEPADANATIGATPPTVSRETPTADDKLTADTAHNHARTPGQENDTRLLESVRNTPRPASGQRDDGVGDGDGDGEGVAVVEEKTKRGSGWVVERRVLVTTTRPNTGDAAPVAESGSAVCDATPPVRCATPEPAHEKVDTSIPMPTLKVDEAALPALEPVPVTAHLPAAQRKGPVQLLDLPPEVRKHIYGRMSEEEPIRMCRHDDPVLVLAETRSPRRQFYNLTQVCHQIRDEFLPMYAKNTKYTIDLWAQKAHLAELDALKGQVSMDIDAACFDMEPIDMLPLIRCLTRTRRTDAHFASTEGVVFRSIQAIVDELNKLLPSLDGSNMSWLDAVNGPIKRIDLHLFPHEDVRQYYRFRGAEPLLRIVYPSAASEEWMKRSSKSDGYEEYLTKTGLDTLGMHVVVGHASRRTTNEGRLPLDWRMSLQLSRLSVDGTRTPRISMDVVAARMSMDRR